MVNTLKVVEISINAKRGHGSKEHAPDCPIAHKLNTRYTVKPSAVTVANCIHKAKIPKTAARNKKTDCLRCIIIYKRSSCATACS